MTGDSASSDLEARRQTADAAARLAAILAAAQDAIINLSPAGIIEGWNPAAERLLGYRSDEAIGRPLEIYCPEDRRAELAAAIESVRTGNPVSFETVRKRKDGTLFDALVIGAPIVDAAGSVVGLKSLIRDISDRKRFERSLQDSEARLRLACAAGRLGVFEIDWIARRRHWSAELRAIFGLPAEQSIEEDSKLLERLLSPDDRAAFRQALALSLDPAGDGEYRSAHRIRRPDGTEAWVELRGKTHFASAADGRRPLRTFGVVADITERKSAEARQALLNRELDHRVKNLLSVVQSIAQFTFADEKATPALQALFLGRMQALAHVQDFLAESGAHSANLAAIAEAELKAFGERAKFSGPDLAVQAEVAQGFALVLHELATNAVKHGALKTPAGSAHLEWRIAGGDAPLLVIEWRERGGPAASRPRKTSFGFRLIESALPGSPTIEFGPEGLVYSIAMPLESVAPKTERT